MPQKNNQSYEVSLDGVLVTAVVDAEYGEPEYPDVLSIEAVNVQGRNFIENLTEEAIDNIAKAVWDQVKGRVAA